MSFLRVSTLFAAFVALAGCSQAPVAFSGPSAQNVLAGASQWQEMARDAANQVVHCMNGQLESGGNRSYEPSCKRFKATYAKAGLKGMPVYIDQHDGAMPFSQVFHDALETDLVSAGMNVTRDPKDALIIRFRTHLILREGNVPNNSVPGNATMLAGALSGYKALTKVQTAWKSAGILFGGGLALDAYNASKAYGGAQVFVTFALLKGETFAMRRAGAYYIHDNDIGHYASAAPANDLYKPLKSASAPGIRSFNVVAE